MTKTRKMTIEIVTNENKHCLVFMPEVLFRYLKKTKALDGWLNKSMGRHMCVSIEDVKKKLKVAA